jgi:hypothetical protein
VIYFIQAESGPIKIGYAGSVRAIHVRLGLFQTGHMEPLSLLGYVEGDKSVEREYHRMFAADRLRGEWFRYSDDLWSLATDRAWAREALCRQQSVGRWHDWGLTRRDGSLTCRGVVYFCDLERNLLDSGCDLEDFASSLEEFPGVEEEQAA